MRYDYGPLNPRLGLNLEEIFPEDLDRFRAWLYTEIGKRGWPVGTERVGIFDVRGRKAIEGLIRRPARASGRLRLSAEFFRAVRWVKWLEIGCHFDDGAESWRVVAWPAEGVSWADIKARLRVKAAEIPLERRYRLSPDSLALLRWIIELDPDEWEDGMTPPVEESLGSDIRVAWDRGEPGVRGRIERLVAEINEGTDYQLRTVVVDRGTRIGDGERSKGGKEEGGVKCDGGESVKG